MVLNQVQDSNSIDSLLEMRRSDMGKNVARYVLIASLVNVVLGIVMSVALYRQYPQLVFYPLLLMVTAVTGWAYPRLYASGHKILGPYLLIGSLILVAMAAPLLVPDLLIPVAIGFVLILMLGNLVLPERGTLSLVVLIALAIVFDILAVKFWLPGRVTEIDPRVGASIAAVTSGVGVLGAALIMRQVIGDLFRQFIRIRQITHEIELQAAKEQERLLELSRTIDTYVAFLNQVSSGDLSACLEVNEEKALTDPLQRLGVNINSTILNLKQMILQMQNTSTAVRGRAGEILLAMQSQAETATEQSAAIAQTASTVNEVRSIAEHVSVRAQEMAETSQRTVEVSRVGVRAVQDTIQGMTQIRERVDAIGSNTISLSERTKQIEAIIATVNALASQSNMLALNASIEAARAGEAGQGFAVVATEVRSLAIQSRKATEKIRSILTDIQKAVNATTMATEEGVKMVEVGTEMAAQGQDAIEQLTQAIEQSAQTAMQMLSGGRQQVAGMEQIAVAMKTINETTIQTVTVTRQTEHAVEGLSSLSAQMSDVVGNYRL